MLFANVCAGFIRSWYTGNSGYGIFWVFWLLFCVLCAWGVLALLVSLLHTRLGFLWCASWLDTSFWRCSVECITFGITGGNVRQLIK